MDASPLGQLPGEIRNVIYDYVFSSDDSPMEIKIGENEVPDDVLMKKLGLRTACKQSYEETIHYSMTETKSFVLKPHCTTRVFGNSTITNLFDLDEWHDDTGRYRYFTPERVVLHVGELDVARLPGEMAWWYEMERIVNRIPLEGVARRDVDFAIDLVISAYRKHPQHIVMTLDDVWKCDAPELFRKKVTAGVRVLKRAVGSIMLEEWKVLGQKEVAARRWQLYHDLHTAQHVIPRYLMAVFDSLKRVELGMPRLAMEEEAYGNVDGWLWDD